MLVCPSDETPLPGRSRCGCSHRLRCGLESPDGTNIRRPARPTRRLFARAYDEALDRGDLDLQKRLGRAYVDYIIEMTVYYEGQSLALFDREIPQILLLHANALNAHHLASLIDRLRERHYAFIDLETALSDSAYASPDTYVGPGGITWLHRWAITREVDRSMYVGEPEVPDWVQEIAGLRQR